jgi:hypothetical protein
LPTLYNVSVTGDTMRSNAILACLTLSAVTMTGIACSNSSSPAPTAPTPKFSDTTGEPTNDPLAYPPGPYGVGIGSIVANYDFVGYADATHTTSTMQAISLADFWNPHGKDPSYTPAAGQPDDRLFAADSGYENAGKAKPTVLLIQIASVWCGPCNEEAATILPAKHALYEPCGGEFLLQLADSATPGTAATPKNLFNWTTKYKVNYPGVIDPSYKLDPLYAADAYPQNIIIDTTSMKIVDVIAGEAVPGTCGNYSVCSADSDCTTCSAGLCGDGSSCTADASCSSVTCTPFPFWTKYETLLDKSRTGCTLNN